MSDHIRIINADATEEEIAAIVVALASLSADEPAPPSRRTSAWAAPARAVRRPHHPGADHWRTSNLPG